MQRSLAQNFLGFSQISGNGAKSVSNFATALFTGMGESTCSAAAALRDIREGGAKATLPPEKGRKGATLMQGPLTSLILIPISCNEAMSSFFKRKTPQPSLPFFHAHGSPLWRPAHPHVSLSPWLLAAQNFNSKPRNQNLLNASKNGAEMSRCSLNSRYVWICRYITEIHKVFVSMLRQTSKNHT